MTEPLRAEPISPEAFAPFGTVIAPGGAHKLINADLCRRFDDLDRPDVVDGAVGISLFAAEIRPVPYRFDLMERHPLGSQTFVPMDGAQWLVIVAADMDGRPGTPQAFLATGQQAVTIARNTWHGVLAPISGSGQFAVIDRIGPGANLEEAHLPAPMTVVLP